MKGIGLQSLAGGLLGNPLERPRAVEVDDDRARDDGQRPPCDLNRMATLAEQAADGFPDDPGRGQEQQAGLDQRGNALELGMAVMVLIIRRAVTHPDGEIGDDGGPEIDEAVDRLGQDAEGAGEQGRQELGTRKGETRPHGNQRDVLLLGTGHGPL